jgi:hypothetical protein
MIWQLAYGNLRICVSLPSLNKRAKDSHQDLTYTLRDHQMSPFQLSTHKLKLPLTVCRQLCSEATKVLYATSTFEFTEPHVFRAFALSPHTCVTRLHHITIPQLERNWHEALTPSLVGRLQSLRGVAISRTRNRYSAQEAIPHATHPTWKRNLWRIIRAFQQHKLYAHQTEVKIVILKLYNVDWGMSCGQLKPSDIGLSSSDPYYPDLVKLQDDLKALLLQHTPRRLSKRGARNGNAA